MTVLLALSNGASGAGALPPGVEGLKCEYSSDPTGIDSFQPRLGWEMASEERGQFQTAYQVLAATAAALLARNRGDLWDSGKVLSDQSLNVVYGGRELHSRMLGYWKVRVWNNADQPSSWSEPAFWSMGLLQPQDWTGKWIGLDGGEGSRERSRALRLQARSAR